MTKKKPITESKQMDEVAHAPAAAAAPAAGSERLTTTPDSPYRWDRGAVFRTDSEWEIEFKAVGSELSALERFRGTLAASGEAIFNCLHLADVLGEREGRLRLYAELAYSENTADSAAVERYERARGLQDRLAQATSFIRPELMAIDPNWLREIVAGDSRLSMYRQYFHEVDRWRPHTRSAEVEEALAVFSCMRVVPEAIHTALNSADLVFPVVKRGEELVEVNQGNVEELLASPDREFRAGVYRAYWGQYAAHRNSFTQTLCGRAKYALAAAKVQRFPSALAASLFDDELPEQVFHTVLSSCQSFRPLFQRYFDARARLLGVDRQQEWDLYAPLSPNPPRFSYDQARELVLDSLQPLGSAYVEKARRGLTTERWADVFPAPGKYSNAFSTGAYGARPYLLLQWNSSMSDVGTLSHELGHSMHTLSVYEAQPFCYSDYTMCVAETASNLNQVLLRAHVLPHADSATALAVLDEAFYFAHRYLFLFPTLTEVEHQLHSAFASDGAMGVDEIMNASTASFRAGYGRTVEVDAEGTALRWAPFVHLYEPYYMFKYAVGISAAMDIGSRILAGEPGILQKYQRFLSAGSSLSTIDTFRLVDVDITQSGVYERAAEVVRGYLERLEQLAG